MEICEALNELSTSLHIKLFLRPSLECLRDILGGGALPEAVHSRTHKGRYQALRPQPTSGASEVAVHFQHGAKARMVHPRDCVEGTRCVSLGFPRQRCFVAASQNTTAWLTYVNDWRVSLLSSRPFQTYPSERLSLLPWQDGDIVDDRFRSERTAGSRCF